MSLRSSCFVVFLLAFLPAADLWSQPIDKTRGADPTVDYAAMTKLGPWDDRNYTLTRAGTMVAGSLFADGFESGDTSEWSETEP